MEHHHRVPSTAAETIPLARPAPSPIGNRSSTPIAWSVSPSQLHRLVVDVLIFIPTVGPHHRESWTFACENCFALWLIQWKRISKTMIRLWRNIMAVSRYHATSIWQIWYRLEFPTQTRQYDKDVTDCDGFLHKKLAIKFRTNETANCFRTRVSIYAFLCLCAHYLLSY